MSRCLGGVLVSHHDLQPSKYCTMDVYKILYHRLMGGHLSDLACPVAEVLLRHPDLRYW